jgi:hypothetical protein
VAKFVSLSAYCPQCHFSVPRILHTWPKFDYANRKFWNQPDTFRSYQQAPLSVGFLRRPVSPTWEKYRVVVEVEFHTFLTAVFPNLREPKQFWGTSDLAQLMEPQRELNRAMSQVSHILELSGNPVAVLENVEESTDIAVRPGAVWNIPESAKAYLLDLLQGGGLQLHINYIELLYRAMHDVSEAPRAAFGGMDRNLSGVAMQIELYPLLQKVLRKRAIRSSVYNRRNRMILDMVKRFGGKGNPRSSEGLGTRITEIDPEQYRMRTVWGNVLPQDNAQLVRNEQILVQEGIHSKRRAMDELGVKDPEAEFQHWIEEQEKILQINTNTTNTTNNSTPHPKN